MKRIALLLSILVLPLGAQLLITEVMSSSAHDDPLADGDWFEITNVGPTAVNMANYSFDDNPPQPATSVNLPSYSLAPGASLIVLDNPASTNFSKLWNLDSSVRIITNLNNFPGLSSGGDGVFLFRGNSVEDFFTFGEATKGFSFARFANGDPVPGGLSSDGVFGAYQSEDDSEDIASPGIAENLPEPLPPFFQPPFQTAALAEVALTGSDFRIVSVDPNPDDTITLTSSNTPPWLTIMDIGGGIAQLTGTPPASAVGPHDFEVTATDNTNRSASQTYRIDVLPASSPIILNEYNAVAPDEFLGGEDSSASDPSLGRIEGNGGAWVEFVVTQTSDLRNWTLTIQSASETRVLKLSDHVALSALPAGTILTFTESRETAETAFNRISRFDTLGYAWTNIWMHDPILIDQGNSNHPDSPAIGNNDTRFTWTNSQDDLVYGPSGESIALKDEEGIGETPIAVGSTEVFKLERNPTSDATPLDLNYDDGTTSTFAAPNEWNDNMSSQSFTPYIVADTPPLFGAIDNTKSVRGQFSARVSNNGMGFSVLEAPDFLSATAGPSLIDLTNNRLLTSDDTGKYEVTLSSTEGTATNYLVFELTVHDPTPAVILNEYNAVDPDRYLNGGTAASDSDGGPASEDTHFGRVLGNGGNWFELAVVGDGGPGTTNLTNWSIELGRLSEFGKFTASSTIILSDSAAWSTIENGTLLTFIDKNSANGGLDTEFKKTNEFSSTGYAWSNVYLGTPNLVTGTNLTSLAIDSSNTIFVIKDAGGTVVFGPAGEGVAPLDGVGQEEIFELENDPSRQISPCDISSDSNLGYDDGSSGSTFGSPNIFAPLGAIADRAQDFSAFASLLESPQFKAYLASLGIPSATANGDEDQDDSSNLEEYLLGGDPTDATITPQSSYDPVSNTASFDVRVDDPAYTLAAQRSPDLVSWFTDSLEVTDGASALGEAFVLRSVTYTGADPRMFLRVTARPGN